MRQDNPLSQTDSAPKSARDSSQFSTMVLITVVMLGLAVVFILFLSESLWAR